MGQGDSFHADLHALSSDINSIPSHAQTFLVKSVNHTYSTSCNDEWKKQCMDEEHDGRGWSNRSGMCWELKTGFATLNLQKSKEKSSVNALFLPCARLPNSLLCIQTHTNWIMRLSHQNHRISFWGKKRSNWLTKPLQVKKQQGNQK